MANEDKKDVIPEQGPFDPTTGKRRVVLGQEDYSRPEAGRQSDRTAGPDLYEEPAVREESAASFMRRYLKRATDEEGISSANIEEDSASPVFNEQTDRILAEESTRDVPVGLLGEDEASETNAARLVREKDYAAAEDDTPIMDRPMTDLERRNRRQRRLAIGSLIAILVTLALILFAPRLQQAIFKTPDNSLIFSPAKGLFGPRAGIVEILLGLFGLGLIFSTFFGKRKEESLSRRQARTRRSNPRRTIGLILLLFIPVGFASLFNFTEFRSEDIRFSSLFNQNRLAVYSQVNQQNVFSEGDEIFYTLRTEGAPDTTINLADYPPESIKLLDAKLPTSRNVTFPTEAIDKVVEKGIYTRDEVLRIFINK